MYPNKQNNWYRRWPRTLPGGFLGQCSRGQPSGGLGFRGGNERMVEKVR